jgi:hypothetical protein
MQHCEHTPPNDRNQPAARRGGWPWLGLAALLLFVQTATAQVAYVQSTGLFGTPAGVTTTSTAFATKPVVGHTIVVPVWTWSDAALGTITVTDNAGNTYTQAVNANINQSGGYENAMVWSAPVTASVNNLTVTIATPGNDGETQIRSVALEYSGVGTVDKTNSATGATASATVATTAATSYANELVVAAMGVDNPAAAFSSITPTAGYTARATELQNSGDTAGQGDDQIVTTTGTQSITWAVNSGMSGWAAAIATFKPAGSTTPDHYAIADAGTAVNCQPSPVTITAHSSTHAAVSTTDTITVATSTGHGDWTLTTGSGTFVAGASNSGTASYTYKTGDAGVVVLSLRDTYAETVTINVTDGIITQHSGSAIASEQPPLQFVGSGFRFTNGANVATTIGTQVAGVASTQSLALQAIRTDTSTGACTAAFASGTTVNISLAYQCNNPTSCISGQTLSITNNSTSTNIASNPNSGVSTYTSVPLKFSTANAEAPIVINYSDVGQITLLASYNIPLGSGAGSGNLMAGSGQFVVQPYTFTLSNIKCTTYGAGTCSTTIATPGNNPGATTATGLAFIQAGQPFSATVTAQNLAGNATPNFGREVSPQTVTLTPALVLPASGHLPAITNSTAFGSFSGGVGTGTTFAWPEVGVITLTPGVASYLSTGAVTGHTSGNVGRFIPNGFAVALNTPVIGTACSAGAFSYLGQPLTYTVAPVITVTPQALGGATTQNYTGSLMKLTNGSLTGRSYTPTPASPSLNLAGLPATGVDPAIVDLGTGLETLTFSAGTGIAFNRGGAVVPFAANISLALNVIDTDGVVAPNPVTFGSGSGMSFSTGATQYYGLLALQNAVGSELLDLPMSLTTQYYLSTAQGFTINTADSCSAAPALAFSNFQQSLNSGETCVRDSGNPGASGSGCSAAAAASERYKATASSGTFNLWLAAPGAGNSGSVSVTATAPAWLQYSWGSTVSPVGMATFGIFPGSTSRIHQREVF